jgi:hypothetical protein
LAWVYDRYITSVTTILLVGEGNVGGEAAYDVPFKLTPSENGYDLDSASIEKGLGRPDVPPSMAEQKRSLCTMTYDATSKTLKERPGK